MNHPLEDMFAERLRTERIRVGLSQTELARKLTESVGYAVDGSSITRMEGGQRRVRLVEAVAIAEELGVPLASLLSNEGVLDAQMDEVSVALADAQAELSAAEQEGQRRRAVVERLQEELDSLQRQADDESLAEAERDAEDWRRENLGL
ncbi:helix-turn-helix domain-containing protein [Brachybacterium tyrofermentans]|uniref:helix-turn-helix domain-containing protein n=1 Tax=Brachybacterium tyrofermentans TaxID=47848 RepID=UPI003F8DE54A